MSPEQSTTIRRQLERFVEPALAYLDGLFPKDCPACGRRYPTYAEFLRQAVSAGTMCYDDELVTCGGNPIGTLGYWHCPCGTTLSLSSADSDDVTYRQFLHVLNMLAELHDTTIDDLLATLSRMVRARALERDPARDTG